MERVIPASELIINPDGSVFHLHIKPEMLVDNIILVGDPGRVDLVASFFDKKIHEVSSREFHTITGQAGDVRVARYWCRQHRYCGQ